VDDGTGVVQVPLSKTVAAPSVRASSLLYNEFMVYDVAMVRIRYLVLARFNFK
jgi:hypothetical protein